jgi:class 3 adenylate cyclase
MTSGAAPAPARRLGGVLVTDLVGSTRLRTTLGDEGAEPLRRDHERLLRAVVSRHSGRVEQWLGDGILATFASVSSAARAAIGVQQGTQRGSAGPRGGPLSVRVGFAGGEIEWRGGDCRGAPVDAAHAACEAARGGEILAPRSVLGLVGSREALRHSDAGAGRIAVAWEPPRRAAPYLGAPLSLRTIGQLPWTGRADALSVLRDAYQRAARGEPQLVALRGAPGIGKTRLLAELCAEVDALGGAMVYAAAHEASAAPYDPLEKALRHWVQRVGDLSERLGPRSGELARLVPELLERVPDLPTPTESDPEHEQRLLHDAFAEWLRGAALDEPFVLLLDSLHWASDAAYQLLERTLAQLAESRVLIVTTHRPSDERTARLVRCAATAFGADAARLVDLAGLSAPEVAELVRRVRGDVSAELLGTIHVITRGNPLYITELLRGAALADGEADLPRSVLAALRETVRALDPSAHRVLEAASVIGESFEAPLLADMLGDSEATFVVLEQAARDGLIRELDRERLAYGFSHALLQQAFYGEIGAARAALLHERIGIALERRGDALRGANVAALARHFGLAAPLGHAARAARYAAAAGRQALAQHANAQALELLRAAAQHAAELPASRERCELAIDTGEALRRLGEAGYREQLDAAADLAAELGDGALMAHALLATYRGTFTRAMHVDEAQIARLRRALALLGESEPALRASLLALLGTELAWAVDAGAGERASDEALALARASGDRELLAEVLAQRQWSVFHPIAERVAATRELAELAAGVRPTLRFDAAGSALFTAARTGDRAAAADALETLRQLAHEIDQPLVHWMLAIREATAALIEGRVDHARAFVASGSALAKRLGMPDAAAQLRVQRFWIDAETEAGEPALTALRAAVHIHRELLPFNWSSLAFRCVELGLAAERDAVLASLAPGLATLRRGQTWLLSLCGAAVAAADAGDATLCAWLHEELAQHADEHANFVFGTLGSVARYAGLVARVLGRNEDAEHWLARAAERNGAFGAPAWRARALLDLAELGFERDGKLAGEASAGFDEARELSSRLGLVVVGARAERLRARWGLA